MELLEMIKPQLEAMNQMYQNGYEEGRRSAFAEMKPIVARLEQHQTSFKEDMRNRDEEEWLAEVEKANDGEADHGDC